MQNLRTSKGNSIWGGAGNDTLVGSNTNSGDVFRYTAGNDVIIGFDGNDKFDIDGTLQDSIKSGKTGRTKLTFKIDKENSVVFRTNDATDVPDRISLNGAGGGYLTKDGVANSLSSGNGTDGKYTLKLFSNAKGTIDLTDTTIYGSTTITSVNAEAATKQSLTLVAKSVAGGADYNFAANKKRDTFVYDAGAVSITGFESGKDRHRCNFAQRCRKWRRCLAERCAGQ